MHAVVQTMGTALSFVIEGVGDRAAFDQVTAVFQAAESRFSLYEPGSELSRVASGELSLDAASDELRSTYVDALEWRSATGGAFTPHRPDGVIDLDGIVKSAAMREAGAILRARGATSWCLNVGGDVLVDGVRTDGSGWVLGITDPADRSALVCAVELSAARGAAATSGSAERGDHIWRTVDSDDAIVQATVISGDIVLSDVLATAIVSGGRSMLDEATELWDVDVLTVDRLGALTATPGIGRALARA
jgi:thiamine biosynthesis lipoprotein